MWKVSDLWRSLLPRTVDQWLLDVLGEDHQAEPVQELEPVEGGKGSLTRTSLCLREMTTTFLTMLLKTTFISYPSVSTSHTCGIILWAGFLEAAKTEVDKLHEH